LTWRAKQLDLAREALLDSLWMDCEAGEPEIQDSGYYRRALVELYEVHNPPKVQDVDNLLIKYEGYEDELLRVATEKYLPTTDPMHQNHDQQQQQDQLSFVPISPPSLSTPKQTAWYHAELMRVFEQYDPVHLGQVDHLLRKYAGHETGTFYFPP
jgi:hypothetical protein